MRFISAYRNYCCDVCVIPTLNNNISIVTMNVSCNFTDFWMLTIKYMGVMKNLRKSLTSIVTSDDSLITTLEGEMVSLGRDYRQDYRISELLAHSEG